MFAANAPTFRSLVVPSEGILGSSDSLNGCSLSLCQGTVGNSAGVGPLMELCLEQKRQRLPACINLTDSTVTGVQSAASRLAGCFGKCPRLGGVWIFQGGPGPFVFPLPVLEPLPDPFAPCAVLSF